MKFFLSTQAKDRGYGNESNTKMIVAGDPDNPIRTNNVNINMDAILADLPLDAQRAILQAMDKQEAAAKAKQAKLLPSVSSLE